MVAILAPVGVEVSWSKPHIVPQKIAILMYVCTHVCKWVGEYVVNHYSCIQHTLT